MSNAWLNYGGKSLKFGSGITVSVPVLPPIAQKTLRFQFKDSFNPNTDMPSVTGMTWTSLGYGIYDFTADETNWTSQNTASIFDYFSYSSGGTTVFPMSQHAFDIIDSDLTGVTNISYLFKGARQLGTCNFKHLEDVTTATQTFGDSRGGTRYVYLTSINDLYMPSLVNAVGMFYNAYNLSKIPSIDAPLVTDVHDAFHSCYTASEGILDMYQYLSTKSVTVSWYSNCFTYCGRDSATGAAELAQIPSSWGGTGA